MRRNVGAPIEPDLPLVDVDVSLDDIGDFIDEVAEGLEDVHDYFSPLDEEFDALEHIAEEMATTLAEAKAVQAARIKSKANCGKQQLVAFGLAVILGATWSPFKGGRGRR